MQDFASFGVRLACEKAGEETFEADHVLVTLGQGTDADEDLAKVGEGRTIWLEKDLPGWRAEPWTVA
ncbi:MULTISPECIES: hypothetical protein [Streptomyces]|uniref:hypothetical protein n=1 Tax=Streptomyces TaxID=1883 RepID=UPI0031CE88A8